MSMGKDAGELATELGGRGSLEELGQLHGLLTRVLIERLLEGGVSAAELNVVRQFLKDNGVDIVQPGEPDLSGLIAGLPVFDDGDEDEQDSA